MPFASVACCSGGNGASGNVCGIGSFERSAPVPLGANSVGNGWTSITSGSPWIHLRAAREDLLLRGAVQHAERVL